MYYKIHELTCVTCKNKVTIKTANRKDYSKQICTDYSAYKLLRCPNCDAPMRDILADSGLLILDSQPSNLRYLKFNKFKQEALA
jgi:hypothetical protein